VSCAILKFDEYRVEYVNAAHPDAIVRRAGGSSAVAVRPKDGAKRIPPLGKHDMSGSVGALGFSMASGDALLLYSAGLAACVNGKGEAYGAERLATAFGRADPENAESMLTSVMIDFRNYVAGAKRPADIVAMVLLKR
jgi:serine phosphatase RsbU (regulator of sigma subunit)